MKYVTLAGDRKFEMHDEPMFPVNGSPIIKVSHSSVCGTDFHWWQQGSKHLGQVIGHEFSGVIDDPGSSGFQKGDRVAGYTQNVYNEPCGHCDACLGNDWDHCTNRRVYTWKGGDLSHPGSYSEYTTWFPKSMYVLPEGISLEEGCLIEPFSVGLHAVLETGVKPGDKCLILGGGIIGLTIAEWLRVYGAGEITITELNSSKLNTIKGFGVANHVLKADVPDLEEQLNDISQGGYDICFDCVGVASAVNQGIHALKKEFRMKFTGVSLPNHYLELDYDTLVLRQIQFRGSKGHQFNEFSSVARSVAGGMLELKKYISKRIPFTDIQKGFEEYEASAGGEIKAVIVF